VARSRLAFAWVLSVALHVAVVALVWRSISNEARPARLVPIVLHDLRIAPDGVSPRTRSAAESTPGRTRPTVARSPRVVVVRESPPPSAPVPDRTAPRVLHEPSRVGFGAAFRPDRSLSAFLEKCREGSAPRDSILDPEPTPREVAVARTIRQCNEAALNLHALWNRERFAEEYRRNFPGMQ
jgi:hypothetical protein